MGSEELIGAALAGLAARHDLSGGQVAQLRVLLELLERDERAPTSVRDALTAVDVHLADSLAALEIAAVRAAGRIADLGAGAGFPGLALAVALPASELWLIESQARKCLFLEQAATRAGLGNVRVVCVRAEQWREGRSAHDLVVARAVAAQPVVLEYAAPLLRLGGSLVDWRGRAAAGEERAAQRAAEELGLSPAGVRRVEPFAGARDHHLHVFEKVAETPARFPRRAGMARKRPLGT